MRPWIAPSRSCSISVLDDETFQNCWKMPKGTKLHRVGDIFLCRRNSQTPSNPRIHFIIYLPPTRSDSIASSSSSSSSSLTLSSSSSLTLTSALVSNPRCSLLTTAGSSRVRQTAAAKNQNLLRFVSWPNNPIWLRLFRLKGLLQSYYVKVSSRISSSCNSSSCSCSSGHWALGKKDRLTNIACKS